MPDNTPSTAIRPVGRPPELAAQVRAAEKLARRIQSAVRAGMGDIADRYPELVKTAIDMAINEHDRQMLRLLLELPTKFLPETQDEDSPFFHFMERITITRQKSGPLIGGPAIEGEAVDLPNG